MASDSARWGADRTLVPAPAEDWHGHSDAGRGLSPELPLSGRGATALTLLAVALTAALAMVVDWWLLPDQPVAWVYGLPVLVAATRLRVRWVVLIGLGAVVTQVLTTFVEPGGRADANWLVFTVGAVLLTSVAVWLAIVREELQMEVAQRHAAEAEARRLYGQAQDALHVRDQFLAIAAHELKTPLTGLLISAQLVAQALETNTPMAPDRQQRMLRRMALQARQLHRLVANLLDVSRLGAGKLALERRPTDLVALVQNMADQAQDRTQRHALVVHAPAHLSAEVDSLRLEQVLTNLLDNAIKYSPAGGEITITLDQPAPGTARLRVQDQGVGIPPDRLPHVFTRLYQAHGEGHLTGLGLGLYICREIVERHGGSIEATCPAGGGTIVTVILPTVPACDPGYGMTADPAEPRDFDAAGR